MVNWQSRLWKRWISKLMELPEARRLRGRSARRRVGGRRRSLTLERLEDRLVPAIVLPPVAIADAATMNTNSHVTIDVLTNDFDPDGKLDLSSLVITSIPAHGTVVVEQAGFGGNEVFSPVVLHPFGYSLLPSINGVVDQDGTIELRTYGAPPPGSPGGYGDYPLFVRLGESDFSNFDADVFDLRGSFSLPPIDGFISTYFRGQIPGTPFVAWLDFTPSYVAGILNIPLETFRPTRLVYSPDPDFKGTDVFAYTVQDNGGAVSNEATITVTVLNEPPFTNNDSIRTKENSPVAIGVLANDSDYDGTLDESSLMVSSGPAHGTATVQQSANGPIVLYVPDAGFRGRDVFRYTVQDNDGATAEAAVAVMVLSERPVALDDSATIQAAIPVAIDVLLNDSVADGLLDPSSLTITAGPTRGTVSIEEEFLAADDNGSPVGNGFASAMSGGFATDADGHIKLVVSGAAALNTIGAHTESGDYALFVRLGEVDFEHFDPNVFDFRFDSRLVPGKADSFDIPGLSPDTPFIAWIDSTVGAGTPDTLLGNNVGPKVLVYTPEAILPLQLVVDDPSDVNDGDFSPGHLSLREAVLLADAHNKDTFRYTVRDDDGLVSYPATVTVNLPPPPRRRRSPLIRI